MNSRPRFAPVVLGAVLITVAGAMLGFIANAASPKSIPVITPPLPSAGKPMGFKEVWDAHDAGKAVFIDARIKEEYVEGHIKGAISVPYEDREELIAHLRDTIPQDKRIIAYCDGADCAQSNMLSGYLIKQGWRDTWVFKEGFPAWRDAGLEIGVGDKP